MQDQLTANQSNLQQPRADLQQTTPSLQQGGAPTGAANSSTINQTPSSTPLRVQTQAGQGSVEPATVSQPASFDPTGWLIALAVLIAIMVLAIWPKTDQANELVEEPQPPEPPLAPTAQYRKPKKKKSTKRKKSGRR